MSETKYLVDKINGGNQSPELGSDTAVREAVERSFAKSQGFLLDSRIRKALEAHAMDVAKRYFASRGYVVVDHSAGQPYDLCCTSKKQRLFVEVKGTQTSGTGIILTPGEVRFARRNKGNMALFVLHSIKVSPDGKIQRKGKKNVIADWDVDQGRLRPVSFTYEVPGNLGP